MTFSPPPSVAIPTRLRDAGGFTRAVLTETDARGNPVAILFKGRDELPDVAFDALTQGLGPIVHLGGPPRFMDYRTPDPAAAYAQWREARGASRGPRLLVVDTSPVGIAKLAYELSGDERWLRAAESMEQGTWSAEALELADAIAAMTCVDPTRMDALTAAARAQDDHVQHQMEMAAHVVEAIVTGELSSEIEAWRDTAPRWFEFAQVRLLHRGSEGLDPEVRGYWLERVKTLGAAGAIDQLAGEVAAALGTARQIPGAVQRELDQTWLHLRHAVTEFGLRDDGTRDRDWQNRHAERTWFNENRSPEMFLTVTRALAGDPAARQTVADGRTMLAAHDVYLQRQRARAMRIERMVHPAPEHVADPAALVLVHCTEFPPLRRADGAVLLSTRFDTTGYGRATLHFTLNHTVESHLYGQWDAAGYVVLVPFSAAVAANGNPHNLLGVDTYWTRDPGEPLALPDAVVVKMDPTATELISRRGNDITVKAANFTAADIAHLEAQHLLDTEELDARVSRLVAEGILAEEDADAFRTAHLATAARTLACAPVIEELGGFVVRGGDWACSAEPSITALAQQFGLAHYQHHGSPANQAEELTVVHSNRDGPSFYAPTLTHATPEMRRVAVAAGSVAPIPEPVVERELDSVGLEIVL